MEQLKLKDDGTETACSSSTPSPSPGLEVLNNPLILDHIVSYCGSPQIPSTTLRLVHPEFNNAVLSTRPPRLTISLPLRPPKEREEKVEERTRVTTALPLEEIKKIDPRLAKKLVLNESEFPEDLHPHSLAILTLTSFFLQFNDSIQTLVLNFETSAALRSTVFLLQNSCPALRKLEIKLDLDTWDAEAQYVLPTVSEVKPKFVSFKIVDTSPYETEESGTPQLKQMIQCVLDMAPNLTRLDLGVNLLPPNLEKLTQLKELVWKITFFEDPSIHHCDAPHYDVTPYFEEFGQTLPSLKMLEELEILFHGLEISSCQDCMDMVKDKHMPPLLLAQLKVLLIENPNCFMLEGGIGFQYFSQQNLPLLETLEVFGAVENFVDFQTRLCDFLQRPGSTVIGARSLHLGCVAPTTCACLLLPPSVFPNLTALAFTIITMSLADEDHSFAALDSSDLFKLTFSNCSAMTTLQELKVVCFMKVSMSRFITSLYESDMFKSKALRKFKLKFRYEKGQSLIIDTCCTTAGHGELTMMLAKTFLRTKHMEQVVLRNFMIHPNILLPVATTIARLNLPVSFGKTELVDQALKRMTLDEDPEEE